MRPNFLEPMLHFPLVSGSTDLSCWPTISKSQPGGRCAFIKLGSTSKPHVRASITEPAVTSANATVGGLLNATFGNATEMIVCVFAIRSGLLRVVQLSLLGSVLSNLLLVLGTAFLLGGLRHKVQTFSVDSVKANTSLLMLGMITLLMPNLLDSTNSMLDTDDALRLSRLCSVVLLVVYPQAG